MTRQEFPEDTDWERNGRRTRARYGRRPANRRLRWGDVEVTRLYDEADLDSIEPPAGQDFLADPWTEAPALQSAWSEPADFDELEPFGQAPWRGEFAPGELESDPPPRKRKGTAWEEDEQEDWEATFLFWRRPHRPQYRSRPPVRGRLAVHQGTEGDAHDMGALGRDSDNGGPSSELDQRNGQQASAAPTHPAGSPRERDDLVAWLAHQAAMAPEAALAARTAITLTPLAVADQLAGRESLWPILPGLVQGAASLTRYLHRRQVTRMMIKQLPQLLQCTVARLAQLAAQGQAPAPRLAANLLHSEAQALLRPRAGNPNKTGRSAHGQSPDDPVDGYNDDKDLWRGG